MVETHIFRRQSRGFVFSVHASFSPLLNYNHRQQISRRRYMYAIISRGCVILRANVILSNCLKPPNIFRSPERLRENKHYIDTMRFRGLSCRLRRFIRIRSRPQPRLRPRPHPERPSSLFHLRTSPYFMLL